MAVEIGLDLDAEQLDQARRRIAEDRAGHRPLALLGLHRDAHQRVIVALALGLDLAHLDAALLGEEGRIDHVHRVGLDAQEAGEHRAETIGFWLSSAAAPSLWIETRGMEPCESWPIRLPSFSASAI